MARSRRSSLRGSIRTSTHAATAPRTITGARAAGPPEEAFARTRSRITAPSQARTRTCASSSSLP